MKYLVIVIFKIHNSRSFTSSTSSSSHSYYSMWHYNCQCPLKGYVTCVLRRWRGLVQERSRPLARVVSKSALVRSLTYTCFEIALVKNKTDTLSKHTSVLAGIFSDNSDDSDTNFIYILLASECQQRNNEEHSKTNKTPNEITVCLQTNSWVTWLKLLGSKFFWSPKNESALAGTSRLVKDRSRESGSIQERSVIILAPYDLDLWPPACCIVTVYSLYFLRSFLRQLWHISMSALYGFVTKSVRSISCLWQWPHSRQFWTFKLAQGFTYFFLPVCSGCSGPVGRVSDS